MMDGFFCEREHYFWEGVSIYQMDSNPQKSAAMAGGSSQL